jgi:hypothetical protein
LTEQQNNTDLEKIESSTLPTPVEKSAASLEQQLSREIDGRKSERFYTAIILVVMFDVIVRGIPWFQFAAVFLLELVFLISFARTCGMQEVVTPLERLFNAIIARLKHEKADDE